MGLLPFYFGESSIFESPPCIERSPHFVSSSFLYGFPIVRAGDLVSTPDFKQEARVESCRFWPPSILEKVTAATFTLESGVTAHNSVSDAKCTGEAEAFPLELSMQSSGIFFFRTHSPRLACWPSWRFCDPFLLNQCWCLGFLGNRQTEICVQEVFGWSSL